MTATEYVILVDEHDREIGTAPKLYAHEQALLHRAFSIFVYRVMIIDSKMQREWLLQQRAHEKYHSPGLWTNTCCSHPKPNEPLLRAATRRLQEEMGFTLPLLHCGQFKYQAAFENGLTEYEIDHVLVGEANRTCLVTPDPKEVAQFKWLPTEQLLQTLHHHPDHFTPWFAPAFQIAMATTPKEDCHGQTLCSLAMNKM